MFKLLKLLQSKTGMMLISIIWGFGLACVFRQACKDRKCIVYMFLTTSALILRYKVT